MAFFLFTVPAATAINEPLPSSFSLWGKPSDSHHHSSLLWGRSDIKGSDSNLTDQTEGHVPTTQHGE